MANGSLHTCIVLAVSGWIFSVSNGLRLTWNWFKQAGLPWLSVMVFLLYVWRLTLVISRFVSRNGILCETTLTARNCLAFLQKYCFILEWLSLHFCCDITFWKYPHNKVNVQYKIWKRLGLLKTFNTVKNTWVAKNAWLSGTQWHSKC